MPTVDDKGMIDKIIAANGHYMDDPQVLAIYQYTNNWGGMTYFLAYHEQHVRSLYSSEFCHDIKCLWSNRI